MSAPRNKLLARLHCIKKEQGWDDDAYRDILEARSGQRSAADLDDAALARVVAALGGQKPRGAPAENEWAWVNKVDAEKQGFLWKIRRVCINLGIKRGQQVVYAEGVAARIDGHQRYLRMMDATELWKLIGPLERTARYKEGKA
ncbi:MAG: hypothetical protein A3H93_09125 [Rhodocyclales bacterium RIFCSPLOWO2_02_FULL_63_24]|nr:MAG: hypothetical protein A3H93_09125 [Rhodocyclales bacterium RIFCSPLOWO2_02_FULL_63_24]